MTANPTIPVPPSSLYLIEYVVAVCYKVSRFVFKVFFLASLVFKSDRRLLYPVFLLNPELDHHA